MSPDERSLSQQRFGERAHRYVNSPDHAQGEDLDLMLEMAAPEPDWVVLDVATGGGHTALKFAPHVARVVATDITPEMLDAAKAFIQGQGVDNVEFREANAEDLPFSEGRFDLVTCRIAPHHFYDAQRFVLEASRVLKPGGLLLVQDHLSPPDEAAAAYIEQFERLRDPSHLHAFSEAEWREMYATVDLDVVRVEKVVKTLEFLPWAKRQDSSPETVARLEGILRDAPPTAQAWMSPRNLGTPQATFQSHHILIAGRKGS